MLVIKARDRILAILGFLALAIKIRLSIPPLLLNISVKIPIIGIYTFLLNVLSNYIL